MTKLFNTEEASFVLIDCKNHLLQIDFIPTQCAGGWVCIENNKWRHLFNIWLNVFPLFKNGTFDIKLKGILNDEWIFFYFVANFIGIENIKRGVRFVFSIDLNTNYIVGSNCNNQYKRHTNLIIIENAYVVCTKHITNTLQVKRT